MLDRSNQQRHRRSKRYRQRQRDGVLIVPVPIDATVLGWLIDRAKWLPEADAHDRTKIGAAITRMLREAAGAQ